jgi:hypothetical protein
MKQRDEVMDVKIVGGLREASTPWAGVALLVELIRRSSVDELANKILPTKGPTKGLRQGQTVESFVLLMSGSFIPPESRPLAALKEVKRQTISSYVEAVHPGWDVTLDVDVQLIETTKDGAHNTAMKAIRRLGRQKCVGRRPW